MTHSQSAVFSDDAAKERNTVRPIEPPAISLKTNFSWTFAGNIVYGGCQWGVLVVIAKLGSPQLVGQLALALAITAPAIAFCNMQLSGVQATDSQRVYHFRDYLTLRLLSTLVALGAIALVTMPLPLTRSTEIVVTIVALTKAADAVSDIFFGLLQQREQMRSMGIALMINGVLTLAGVTTAMWMTGSIIWAALASMFASVFTLLAYSVRGTATTFYAAAMTPRWNGRTMARLARIALPLGLAGMCVSAYGNMPRYFVEHYYGERALGLFAAVAYAMTAGTTVVGALGQSAVPRLARYWASGNTLMFWRLLRHLIGFGALLGVAGVGIALVSGETILRTFYRAEYADHADLLVWIMVAGAIGYVGSFLGYGVNATRAFDRLFVPYLAVAAVAALSSWLLVPRYGLLGAAWATAVTYVAAGLVPPLTFISLRRRPA
jgi:O-antigen/teichoic acid export membrane protein